MINQKLVLIFSFLLFTQISCNVENSNNTNYEDEHLYVASWNVENLFDTVDDPDKNDEWFLPSSEINWDDQKYNTKLKNLSEAILFMNNGNGPDILALQEVENKKVIDDLVEKYLNKNNYQIVHTESPDARGIDNALIFNNDVLNLISYEAISINFDEPKSSRDILHVNLKHNLSQESINFYVNHWPSRRAGLKETEKFRINAAEALLIDIKDILSENGNSNIIILGDFNDLPSNISISNVLGVKYFNCDEEIEEGLLYNLSTKLFQKGKGSYKYRDHWNMLDQIIVSRSLLDEKGLDYRCDSFEIFKPSFLIEKSGKYAGTPLPTFGGRKYLGGYSDHFPVISIFYFKN